MPSGPFVFGKYFAISELFCTEKCGLMTESNIFAKRSAWISVANPSSWDFLTKTSKNMRILNSSGISVWDIIPLAISKKPPVAFCIFASCVIVLFIVFSIFSMSITSIRSILKKSISRIYLSVNLQIRAHWSCESEHEERKNRNGNHGLISHNNRNHVLSLCSEMFRQNFIYGYHHWLEARNRGTQFFSSWRKIYKVAQAGQIGIFKKILQSIVRIKGRSEN